MDFPNIRMPLKVGKTMGRAHRFLEVPVEIRKIIYTIILIENLNRNIRNYTKTNAHFLQMMPL
jgi:transposase-like protein